MSNDIYAIVGRIKNGIARKDLALSSAGEILVNSYALMLKDLYDYADTLEEWHGKDLKNLLLSKESLPEYVISLSTPKEMRPLFESNEEALTEYNQKYEDLGGDRFWEEAESSSVLTENHREIMRLSRHIQMLNYLIGKKNE